MSTELCATQVMAMMGSCLVVTGTLQAQHSAHGMLQCTMASYQTNPASEMLPDESHTKQSLLHSL